MSSISTSSQWSDPSFINSVRKQMVQFATLQLNDYQLAEDVVQDALIGAYKNSAQFRGQSAFKSWLFAILKNKITDVLRQRYKNPISPVPENTSGDLFEDFFDEQDHWTKEAWPTTWNQPLEAVHNEQFWGIFETCLNQLPGDQARVFMMREFLGFESQEICQEATISTSNLHVLLHRARLRLRECLSIGWFNEPDTV